MFLRPIGGYVVVKPLNQESVTASGLILPESAGKERPEQGEVIAISETALMVKVGEQVIFKKYAPDEFKVKEETFLLIREDEIMAVYEA